MLGKTVKQSADTEETFRTYSLKYRLLQEMVEEVAFFLNASHQGWCDLAEI